MTKPSHHVSANYPCGFNERFVEAHDYDDTIPNWRRVAAADVTTERVVRCSVGGCDEPARVMDCHWPWMSGACRCGQHDDLEKYPLDD